VGRRLFDGRIIGSVFAVAETDFLTFPCRFQIFLISAFFCIDSRISLFILFNKENGYAAAAG
jgi:hypothetical protein